MRSISIRKKPNRKGLYYNELKDPTNPVSICFIKAVVLSFRNEGSAHRKIDGIDISGELLGAIAEGERKAAPLIREIILMSAETMRQGKPVLRVGTKNFSNQEKVIELVQFGSDAALARIEAEWKDVELRRQMKEAKKITTRVKMATKRVVKKYMRDKFGLG